MKKPIFICITMLCILVLASCGKKETTVPEEKVELVIAGQLDNFEALEHVISQFENKYSGCDVAYVKIDDYTANIPKRLKNENETTDLFLSSRGDFTGTNPLLDYAFDYNDEQYNIDLSGLNTFLTESQEIGNKLYTVPLAMNPRGIIVNKKILSDCNVTMPTNYAQFLSACESIKNANLTPIAGFNPNNGLNLIYPYMANAIVHDANYATIFNSINNFEEGTSEYFRDSFERLNRLVEEGYIDYNTNLSITEGYESQILEFFKGKIAFSPCSAELVSGMKKREEKSEYYKANPFEYEFCCIPIGDDGAYGYWQTWQGISVNKESKNLDWAVKFANFLFKEENMASLASIKGMPSNTKNATDDSRYKSLFSLDSNHVAEASQFQNTVYSILNNEIFKKMTLALDDPKRLDVEAALLKYEEKIAAKRGA